MLFENPLRFKGLPGDGFSTFAFPGRAQRREQIIAAFHGPLADLGRDLLERLEPLAGQPLHVHLPRLDWPREYEPFCTWLALSCEAHGYQAGPQLNVGVHADHVGVRLGWDTASDDFGRFEFLCRHGGLDRVLIRVAEEQQLRFRVYASAPWPKGSALVFESPDDLRGAFDEVTRRGVWWELGHRFELPECRKMVESEALGHETLRIFEALWPAYERVWGHHDRR